MFPVETMDILSSHFEPSLFSRVLRALEDDRDRNNNQRTEATKRCLFGKPDPEDTKRMLREQLESDRKRLKERFGLDVENIENVCEREKRGGSRKAKRAAKRTAGERRQAFRPFNKQLKLTGG